VAAALSGPEPVVLFGALEPEALEAVGVAGKAAGLSGCKAPWGWGSASGLLEEVGREVDGTPGLMVVGSCKALDS
jgi:hypothetical protein